LSKPLAINLSSRRVVKCSLVWLIYQLHGYCLLLSNEKKGIRDFRKLFGKKSKDGGTTSTMHTELPCCTTMLIHCIRNWTNRSLAVTACDNATHYASVVIVVYRSGSDAVQSTFFDIVHSSYTSFLVRHLHWLDQLSLIYMYNVRWRNIFHKMRKI